MLYDYETTSGISTDIWPDSTSSTYAKLNDATY